MNDVTDLYPNVDVHVLDVIVIHLLLVLYN